MQEMQLNPWIGKIHWRRKCQPTPVFLSGKFHGQRSLVSYSPWGCKSVPHDLTIKQQKQQCSDIIRVQKKIIIFLIKILITYSFLKFTVFIATKVWLEPADRKYVTMMISIKIGNIMKKLRSVMHDMWTHWVYWKSRTENIKLLKLHYLLYYPICK